MDKKADHKDQTLEVSNGVKDSMGNETPDNMCYSLTENLSTFDYELRVFRLRLRIVL